MVQKIDYKPGVAENLRYDFPAGIVVFLVAVPLCLGIALALNAPLFSGIIAGIVGGMVVSIFSGSELSVSGPAAGLTVIVASSIAKLGSFEAFLTAVVLAGMLQIVFGVLRAGIIGDYVPNSVIKGMLAAIGIIIIIKQFPYALGHSTGQYDDREDIEFLRHFGEDSAFAQLVATIFNISPVATLITVLSIALLILWDRPFLQKYLFFRLVPGPLAVVFLGVLINQLFIWLFAGQEGWYLSAERGQLVVLPTFESPLHVVQGITLPDMSALTRKDTYIVALTLAVVASIETLLTVEAVDKLDPFKRISDKEKELKAQGIGNLVSGLLGGLPMTAVIVRSSANVYAGARTRTASFVHGFFLLISVLFIPNLLNMIPLASLAAILMTIGYKLASVKLFKAMYKTGGEQFIAFITTIVAIVFTDLLIGIFIGSAVAIFFVLRIYHHSSLTVVSQDNCYLIRCNKDMSFVNKAELKRELSKIPDNSMVIIEGTKAMFIDRDIYEVIDDFRESAKYRNIEVELKYMDSKYLPLFGEYGRKKKKEDNKDDGVVQETLARK
ncbi:MAG: SulP family inorganic anion transporter [Chloroherpetonaceae bacterium]|nr:SulP family inorganic anion transporter [Chloroherpetonaceae bacterium]